MRALIVAVLVLAGCGRNAELRVLLSDEERQLAQLQAIADKVNEDRHEMEAAEQDLANALAQFPEVKAAVEVLKAPPFTLAPPPTFPSLPHESLFAGSERAQLRRQLQDVEMRIAQLDKIRREVQQLSARRAHVRRQLETPVMPTRSFLARLNLIRLWRCISVKGRRSRLA